MQDDKDGRLAILKSVSSEVISKLKKINNTCPTLPTIYEFGSDYIIEENIDGTNLIDIIDNETVSFSAFQKMIYDLCDALTHLHKAELCHMDISPENIIRSSNKYTLIDYSASTVFDALTNHVSYGTREFCSPEHYAFDFVGAQSDIYSLGKLIKFVLQFIPDCSPDCFSDLIKNCTLVDKKQRISGVENFLQEFNIVCQQHTHYCVKNGIIKKKTDFDVEKYVSTEEVFNSLSSSYDLAEFLKSNENNFVNFDVSDYFNKILKEKGLKKAEVIEKSGIERTYGYQLLNGTKKPSRDKMIQLCIGAEFNFEETQMALKRTGFAPLYPKNRRDCIIIYSIKSGHTIVETDEMLYKFKESLLNEE